MYRLTFFIIIMVSLIKSNILVGQNFKNEQLQKSRVKSAYTSTGEKVQQLLDKRDLQMEDVHLFLQAFKWERKLELWVKHKDSTKYHLLKTYDFCVLSGKLGPKTKQGDFQVPEGYYYIDRFNPWSAFHLSLGINYPNSSDKKRYNGNLGGDIFIHGDCVSIGCIPITDELIKEVYVLAVEAKNNGQRKIPVHIYPFRMNVKNMAMVEGQLQDSVLLAFWKNLQEGYLKFELNSELLSIRTDNDGRYLFD